MGAIAHTSSRIVGGVVAVVSFGKVFVGLCNNPVRVAPCIHPTHYPRNLDLVCLVEERFKRPDRRISP